MPFCICKRLQNFVTFFCCFRLRFFFHRLHFGMEAESCKIDRGHERASNQKKNGLMLAKRRRIIHNTEVVSEEAAKKIYAPFRKEKKKNILLCFASAPFGCVFLVLATTKKQQPKRREKWTKRFFVESQRRILFEWNERTFIELS